MAGIAFWHTKKEHTPEKWESILQLYNQLLQLQYSPVAALNRTYALSKTNGKAAAIIEAEKLQLTAKHFYFSLLGHLYTGVDNFKAMQHFETALKLTGSPSDKITITKNLDRLKEKKCDH